jgi:thiamine pyrophosphate-dependent acetolactate synthase large subunit-like protein
MHEGLQRNSCIPLRDALQVLVELRDETTVVVTHQGSSRVWPRIAEHPLDFHYNPSTMGGAVPFGLGLALAMPRMQVMVISGDGSLTMSLGSLVSVAASGAENVTVVVLDNGLYEVTGGQRVPSRQARVDFAALALSAGFASASNWDDLALWQQEAGCFLQQPGPRLIALRVETALPEDMHTSLPSIAGRLAQLAARLRL